MDKKGLVIATYRLLKDSNIYLYKTLQFAKDRSEINHIVKKIDYNDDTIKGLKHYAKHHDVLPFPDGLQVPCVIKKNYVEKIEYLFKK